MYMVFAYYAEAARDTRKDLCCYCTSADGPTCIKKKIRAVLPVCADCLVKGLDIPERTPLKQTQ